MDPARWEQIERLFHEAAVLDGPERAEFLEAVCGGDVELRREVESLLAAENADTLLDAGLGDLAQLVDPSEESAVGPTRAGPYRIVETIGRGGMGTVYRAERDDDQYRREVALKVVRIDLADAEAARRFRRERQILATLEHSNIARLYDGGVTPEGQPFLAMEFVPGIPIHRYCDDRSLSVRDRLRLFEQVCSAVDYAHRNLVIHRDLKPTNILVTESGEVKLLDFGIAKLLGDDADDESEPLTRAGHRILTPEYASPEQLKGESLSTASDVYSLGVLLYELLTGRRPGPDDSAAVTAPSTAVTRSTDPDAPAPESIAAARATTPVRLQRVLRGELDTVVLHALRVEPERRYPTAAALLGDLERYRTGLPIEARSPTLMYRTGKFLRRNRLPVAAAAVALLGLGGGLWMSMEQTRIAREERDVAEAVSRFMENMFTASNPFAQGQERLDTMRLAAFLERAAEQIDSDLADQPVVRARMQATLGEANLGLGVAERAEPLLNAALETYRGVPGREMDQARVLVALGRLGLIAGDMAGAVEAFEAAHSIALAEGGEESLFLAEVRGQLASALAQVDRVDEAESLLTASIRVRRDAFDEVSRQVGDDLNLLGSLLYRKGEIGAAIEAIREARDVFEEVHGPDHPITSVITQNLGFALNRAGRYAEAEPVLQRALEGLRGTLDPRHPNVFMTQNTLANVLASLERWSEADELRRTALASARASSDGPNRNLAIILHDYGQQSANQGEFDRGRELFEENISMELEMNPNSPDIGVSISSLGELEMKADRPEVAHDLFSQALERLQGALPPTHPRVLAARTGLAMAQAHLGDGEAAEAELLRLSEEAEALDDGGMQVRLIAERLAAFYDLQGDEEEAARWRAAAEPTPSGG